MTVVRTAPFRLVRGSAVAVVGLALALAGHRLAGGPAALDAATVLPALAVLTGCVVAAQHAWTLPRLVAALAAVQVVVHGTLWLTAGAQQVDPRLAGLVTATAEHQHGPAAALTPGMLAAHALAVVLAALLLAGVDDAVLQVWALGRAILGAGHADAATVREPAVAAFPGTTPRGRTRYLLVPRRRGPPVRPAPC